MPHATELRQSVDDQDDILIQRLFDEKNAEDPFGLDRDLEPGEKADDAENYEDISDDDLAEDEDAEGEQRSQTGDGHRIGAPYMTLEALTQDVDFPALVNENSLEDNAYDDDLFGEDLLSPVETNSSPVKTEHQHDRIGLSDFHDSTPPRGQPAPFPTSPLPRQADASDKTISQQAALNSKEPPLSKELQRQQELLAMSRNGITSTDGLPAPPENLEELLTSLWPKFERDTIPKFMDLLPPKRARYLGKPISKPPKPVIPSKVNLELSLDQEKSFRVSSLPNKSNTEEGSSKGIITIQEENVAIKDSEADMEVESDLENELVGGMSWQDFRIICEDWNTQSATESLGPEQRSSRSRQPGNQGPYQDFDRDPDASSGSPSTKVSPKPYIIGAMLISFYSDVN